MNYLLDTHVVIWCALSPQKLSQTVKEIILDSKLGVESIYVHQLSRLPLIHRDPFDRMLIATALAEEMRLVTMD